MVVLKSEPTESPINVAKPPITSISIALRQILPVKSLAFRKPKINRLVKAKIIEVTETY